MRFFWYFPDFWVCIFVPQQLLMCGVANINFEDLKKHSKLTSSQTWFTDKVGAVFVEFLYLLT